MNNEITGTTTSPFERIKKINEYGSEYWSARDLMKVLEYVDYRGFQGIIKKAIIACENSGENQEYHFGQVNEMVDIGSNAKRERENYFLSRYACYLVVQNADSSKKPVAQGQTYFAIQTRKQEVSEIENENHKRLFLRNEMKTHNSKLADAAKNAGVTESKDYAIFQNYGYKGLYGGLTAKDIHIKKGLKKSQNILDHMGSTELAANLFRATQTEEKLRRENIKGKNNANKTHYEVGEKVRKTIAELGGTMPENLPSVENIKAIERKQNKLPEANVEQDNSDNLVDIMEDQVSVISEECIKDSNISENEICTDIPADIWEIMLQKLKDEGKMALFIYLTQAKARLFNGNLTIVFSFEQGFTAILTRRPENIQYLKDFFTRITDRNIISVEVIQEND